MRLTKQIDKKYYVIATQINFQKDGDNATQKLGQLEDIEEELGIDLVTLFKALKNHIYVKYKDKIEYVIIEGNVVMYNNRFTVLHLINRRIEEEHDYYFKDYGETWALTKEELL